MALGRRTPRKWYDWVKKWGNRDGILGEDPEMMKGKNLDQVSWARQDQSFEMTQVWPLTWMRRRYIKITWMGKGIYEDFDGTFMREGLVRWSSNRILSWMDIQSTDSSMGRTMVGLEDNTSSKRGKLVGTRFRFNHNLKGTTIRNLAWRDHDGTFGVWTNKSERGLRKEERNGVP